MKDKAYEGWFWCHERKTYFRWEEFISYFKNKEKAANISKL